MGKRFSFLFFNGLDNKGFCNVGKQQNHLLHDLDYGSASECLTVDSGLSCCNLWKTLGRQTLVNRYDVTVFSREITLSEESLTWNLFYSTIKILVPISFWIFLHIILKQVSKSIAFSEYKAYENRLDISPYSKVQLL